MLGLGNLIGGVTSLIDDLHYSGEEKAADLNAAEQIKLQKEQLQLGNATLVSNERIAQLQASTTTKTLVIGSAVALGLGALFTLR